MVKNLVYHLYIPEGDPEKDFPGIYNLHMRYLSHYASIFNRAIFILTIDDLTNTQSIKWYTNLIQSLGFQEELDIKIRRNTEYREAITFYDEVATKLNDLKGITFFGHGKGMSNWTIHAQENLDWVGAHYFYNLNDYKNKVRDLIDGDEISAGVFRCIDKEIISNTYHWRYSGTFFWINTGTLAQYMDENNLKIHPVVNRMYAENFLGHLVPLYKAKPFCKYVDIDGEPLMYTEATKYAKAIAPPNEYAAFRKLQNEFQYGLV